MIVELLSLINLAACLFMLFMFIGRPRALCLLCCIKCLLVYASWLLVLFKDSILDNHSLSGSKWLPCMECHVPQILVCLFLAFC